MPNLAAAIGRNAPPTWRHGSAVSNLFEDLLRVAEDATSLGLSNAAAVSVIDAAGPHALILSVANDASPGRWRPSHQVSAGLSPLLSARSAARVRTLGGLKHSLAELTGGGVRYDAPCRWLDDSGRGRRPAVVVVTRSGIAFEMV